MTFNQYWRLSLYLYFIAGLTILPIHSYLNSQRVIWKKSRRLVLALDGVPYEIIQELRQEGRFRRFQEPARMISTFPSLTNAAMIEILKASESPGYEDHFYDREANRLRGHIQDRLQGNKFIHGTFRDTFDYHAKAFNGALAYVASPAGVVITAQFDLQDFRSTFLHSDSDFFVGYIGETDSLAHLGGRELLESFLITLDRTLEELIADAEKAGFKLEVEMFSDHGNNFTNYRQVKLNESIEAAGFTIAKSLTSSKSVVLPRYGIVGASVLFTAKENRPLLAKVCSKVSGVDFALYKDPDIGDDSVFVLSKRGLARIDRKENTYKYTNYEGDPLKLNSLPDLPVDFADENEWWRITKKHDYPDPLRRIFDGFDKFIKNRADVIISYEDGVQLGSSFLSMFASVRATHGNLLRSESEGFAISTIQKLDAEIRGSDLNELFELYKRTKIGM